MYSIYVYDLETNKLFDYASKVLPVIGDYYCNPSTHICPGHYEVVNRILHTDADMPHVITIRVKKTSDSVI